MSVIALTRDLYAQAKERGITMSQLLEEMNPPEAESKLTAFERALKQQGIRANSVPEKGFSADSVEAFYRTDENKVLFPEYVATTMREGILAGSILPYLTSNTTTIDSNSYKSAYLDFDEKNKEASRKKRVTEASELPTAKIRFREKSIDIYKYGIAIQASYEAIRRMKIDMLARHISFIAVQQGLDETNDVLDILLKGDGNPNTAAEKLKASVLDPDATGGIITRKAYMSALMKFFPYGATTVAGNENAILSLLDMMAPDNMNQILDSLSANSSINLAVRTPQGLFQQVNALYYPDAPQVSGKDALYMLNKDYAVEKVVEAGSDINEADRFITNQTQVLTISENAGFASLYPQATKILMLD